MGIVREREQELWTLVEQEEVRKEEGAVVRSVSHHGTAQGCMLLLEGQMGPTPTSQRQLGVSRTA